MFCPSPTCMKTAGIGCRQVGKKRACLDSSCRFYPRLPSKQKRSSRLASLSLGNSVLGPEDAYFSLHQPCEDPKPLAQPLSDRNARQLGTRLCTAPSSAPSITTAEPYIDLYENYYKSLLWKWVHIKRKVNSSAEPLNHKFLPRAYFHSPCKNRGINGKSDTTLTPAALGAAAEFKMVTECFLHLHHKASCLENHTWQGHCRLLPSFFHDKLLF